MSLDCAECEFVLMYWTRLFAVTDKKQKEAYALCEVCCDRIPDNERWPIRWIVASGVTVCRGQSTDNLDGTYSWANFRRSDPLFFVKKDAAIKYLPRLSTMLTL